MKQMFIWMKRLYQHPQPSLVWCFSLCTFGFGDILMFFSADPVQLCQLWLDHVHMWRHFGVFPKMFDLSQFSGLSTGGRSPFWFLILAYGHSKLPLLLSLLRAYSPAGRWSLGSKSSGSRFHSVFCSNLVNPDQCPSPSCWRTPPTHTQTHTQSMLLPLRSHLVALDRWAAEPGFIPAA